MLSMSRQEEEPFATNHHITNLGDQQCQEDSSSLDHERLKML